jgi:hypothetical protein
MGTVGLDGDWRGQVSGVPFKVITQHFPVQDFWCRRFRVDEHFVFMSARLDVSRAGVRAAR